MVEMTTHMSCGSMSESCIKHIVVRYVILRCDDNMIDSVFRFPIAAASRPVFHFLDKCGGFPTPTPDPDRPGHYLQFEALIGSKKQKLDLSTPDIELASMQPYVKDGKLTRYCEECRSSRKGSKYRSYVCLSQKDEDAHRIIFHPNKKKETILVSVSNRED